MYKKLCKCKYDKILKKLKIHQNRTSGMAQGVDPDFKPKSHKK
jgi:hypothetical protein